MAVAVQVEVEAKAPLVLRGGARIDDRLVECLIGRDRLGIALRAFDDIAVDVDLVAVQMAQDQVRTQRKPLFEMRRELARQFDRAGVLRERAVGAIGEPTRLQRTTVAGRDHDRRIADHVFDELVLTPTCIPGRHQLGSGRRGKQRNARHKTIREAGHPSSVPHSRSASSPSQTVRSGQCGR